MGTLLLVAWGGRKRFKAISQPVEEALWVSLRSLPPNEAIVAVVLKGIVCIYFVVQIDSRDILMFGVVQSSSASSDDGVQICMVPNSLPLI